MYKAEILADSISEGCRLTTFEITIPRFILAEINTHRMLSRNSASSRAIPVEKSIAAIEQDMFVPEAFGAHQKGMSADLMLTDDTAKQAAIVWRSAGDAAVDHGLYLSKTGVHKAWANRILEPFKWHTAIVTATDWGNFFSLRTASNAQPEFRKIALMMQEAYQEGTPNTINPDSGELHLPLVTSDEIWDESLTYPEPWIDWQMWTKVSVGRCARVSYLTHDGVRDLGADIELYGRLLESRHLSPFEHVAQPFSETDWSLVKSIQHHIKNAMYYGLGFHTVDERHANYLRRQVEYRGNLRGWTSQRAHIPNEHDYSLLKETD